SDTSSDSIALSAGSSLLGNSVQIKNYYLFAQKSLGCVRGVENPSRLWSFLQRKDNKFSVVL
ncbi:MAG: hypothetical protein Q4F63_09355, partial [Clostridia bacterium]|nr:hypothetical protein [Clostridia bacterium]